MKQGIFAGKTAVITGGAHGIGRVIAGAFRTEGATVHIIDTQPGDWFVGDISDPGTLERFAASVIGKSGQTGTATCPHLHFGLFSGRTLVDPLPYLPEL